jgi:uncharacterized protein YyaL (SSP411 family)
MAYGGAVLGEHKYVAAAEKAAGFVLGTLYESGRLKRYYRDGEGSGLGFLDDYSFLTLGLLDLYEATFDAKWLGEAKKLAEEMMELFGDESGGLFFLSGKDAEKLIVRNRPSYDGAVPSGNSIAALALLRLGQLTMDERFSQRGEQVLKAVSGQLAQSPASLTAGLIALDFWLGPRQEIVIAGDPDKTDTKEMLKIVRGKFMPNAVILLHATGKAGQAIEKEVPFLAGQAAIEGKATAYVCQNYVCKRPVNSIAELKVLLDGIVRRDK